jgi:hypothetical protein
MPANEVNVSLILKYTHMNHFKYESTRIPDSKLYFFLYFSEVKMLDTNQLILFEKYIVASVKKIYWPTY